MTNVRTIDDDPDLTEWEETQLENDLRTYERHLMQQEIDIPEGVERRIYSRTTARTVKVLASDSSWNSQDVIKNIISAQTLLAKELPEIGWLVEGIIPEQGITVLGGDVGCYKTFIALHAALSSANGQHVLGKYPSKRTRVLYLDEENGERVIRSRLLKLIRPDQQCDEVWFSFFKNIKFGSPEWATRMEKLIKDLRPNLIVVDSMVRFLMGSENSSEDVSKIFEAIKPLKEKYGVSWLILHHTRKGLGAYKSKDDLRGSGDFAAFADVVMMINRRADGLVLSQQKNRHQEHIANIFLQVISKEDGTLTFVARRTEEANADSLPEQCAAEILRILHEEKKREFTTKELESRLVPDSFKRSAYHEALGILIERGSLTKQTRGRYFLASVTEKPTDII